MTKEDDDWIPWGKEYNAFAHKQLGGRSMSQEEFEKLVRSLAEELKATLLTKNSDYAGIASPLSNFEQSIDIGIDPLVGLTLRMLDKVGRIKTFVREGKLEGESVLDAFKDLAGYCVLAQILLTQGRK